MRQFFKRLERSLKLLLLAAIRQVLGHAPSRPAELGAIRRIVLIRPDRIGDAILSTPVFEALRKSMPDAAIDIVLGRRNRSVAPMLPFVEKVLTFSRNPWRFAELVWTLRRARYDVAIDMLLNDSFTSAVITIASGARLKIGFQGSFSALYQSVVARPTRPEHHVPILLRLLAPLDIGAPAAAPLSLTVPAPAIKAALETLEGVVSPGGFVAINISGSSPAKFWGVQQYVHTIRALKAEGFSTIVLGAPADGALVEQIARESGAHALPANPNLAEIAAVLSFSELVVTPDTSIVHIAAALGKPVIDLVPLPKIGAEFGPWGVPHRIVSGAGNMSDIRESDVLAAIRGLIGEKGRRAALETLAASRS
ncbi:MAG TPA: glycosyltransferase family 9 protein [Pseudolabrys sp.]|nr:glycosyltransferase family 9 protein [Pseudolabrys sp.]